MTKQALAVDDSITIRNVVSVSLDKMGYEVISAKDGVEALELVEGKNLDLAVVDIHMPNMGGIELIQKLREKAEYKHTPILVLTTEKGVSTKEQGKEAGASGWITKPFNPDVLESAVKKLCGE